MEGPPPTFFLARSSKSMIWLGLGAVYRGRSPQNLEVYRVTGKILRNKELASAARADGPSCSDADWCCGSRTVLVCAFRILSQGCSSQEWEIFVWRVVEKVWPAVRPE